MTFWSNLESAPMSSAFSSNLSGPPTLDLLTKSRAGFLPPARNSEGKPEPSQSNVAPRLLPVLPSASAPEAHEKRQDADDDPHHCASMTSDRRKAMTPSRFSGS